MFVFLPSQISEHVLIQGIQESVHVMEDSGRISVKMALPFGTSCSYCAVWNNDVYRLWESAANCGSATAEIEDRPADNYVRQCGIGTASTYFKGQPTAPLQEI